MPKAGQKIVTTLRDRRQIEADLRGMLSAGSELEYRRKAQEIASLGSVAISAIVGNLDEADARMLTAMGTVATYLDREEVTAALRRAAMQPQGTDQGRMGAMVILERFLGQPPDDDLLASLDDPGEVAISSMEAVLAEAEGKPAVLVEYAQGLDRQEPDVVLAVVRALRDLGAQRSIEPLRVMAQDVRLEIAAAAIEALGAIRLPGAAQALQMVTPCSAAELRPLAERALRKLQFAGVEVQERPPPDPTWRALVGPVDGLGQQSVWFIQEAESIVDDALGAAHARFLNVLLNDRVGVVEAVAHTRVPPFVLPPRRPQRYLHDIALPGGPEALLMVEASFNYGRRLVAEALDLNRKTQIPVAAVLRLLSPWLWGTSGGDPPLERARLELSAGDGARAVRAGDLLDHPAFVTWLVGSETLIEAAEESRRQPRWELEVWVNRLAGELFAEPVVGQVFARRLVAMSEWLMLAGQEEQARLALVAAEMMSTEAPQDQPFVLALVRRGLELALQSLGQ